MNITVDDAQASPEAATCSELLQLLGAAHGLQERIDGVLESLGLSMAKYMTLDLLLRAGGSMSLSALADSRKCVRSNITQLIDRLEADGFVERVGSPEDRRAIRAQVTKIGQDRFESGASAIRDLEADLMTDVPQTDRAAFLRVVSAFGTR